MVQNFVLLHGPGAGMTEMGRNGPLDGSISGLSRLESASTSSMASDLDIEAMGSGIPVGDCPPPARCSKQDISATRPPCSLSRSV